MSATSKFKIIKCIEALLVAGSNGLNRLEALNQYNDLCLHSTISSLANRHNLFIERQTENHISSTGEKVRLTRYRLVDRASIELAQGLLGMWQKHSEHTQ